MKRIMIFIEGTLFYTKPFLFLFSKKGYKPLGNSIRTVNDLFDKGNEIYLCSYVLKNRYVFIKAIMDYYKMKNIEADTSMRESIAKPNSNSMK